MDKQHDGSGQPAFWQRTPAPGLSALVSGIFGYEERGVAMRGVVEAASLDVPLIINFGSAFHLGLGRKPGACDRYTSFAAGLFAGPVMMDSDGGAQCVQVNFTPLGGRLFFGLPMSELADTMVPLDALGDCAIQALARRLGELNSWAARLDLAEQFVAARLAGADGLDPAVSWAFAQLMQKGGDIRISAIAGKLDWSRRRLVERFRRDIGLPPKAVARIIRFNAAQALAANGEHAGWADIAAACGYADQAHLTREFVLMAGSTPTARAKRV
jgi:AraC-like DNA-binding protein